MYGYIYKTTNKVNGKIYIGQKKSNKFLENKYLGSGKILKSAVKKYGVENFSVELVCWCGTKIELDNAEKDLIKQNNSRCPNIGYNIAYGGEGGDLVTCLSKEDNNKFREKISKLNKMGIVGNKGKHLSEEHKNKIRLANTGKKHSEEWINNQREKVKGLPAWNRGLTIEDERVRKYVHKKGEYKHTAETRLKISKSRKGIKPNIKDKDKWRETLSKALTGRKLSESHAEKCRKVAIGRIWVNNNIVSKMIYPNQLEEYKNKGYKEGRIRWENKV